MSLMIFQMSFENLAVYLVYDRIPNTMCHYRHSVFISLLLNSFASQLHNWFTSLLNPFNLSLLQDGAVLDAKLKCRNKRKQWNCTTQTLKGIYWAKFDWNKLNLLVWMGRIILTKSCEFTISSYLWCVHSNLIEISADFMHNIQCINNFHLLAMCVCVCAL